MYHWWAFLLGAYHWS